MHDYLKGNRSKEVVNRKKERSEHKEMSLVGGHLRVRKRHHEPSYAITPSQQNHSLNKRKTKTLSTFRTPHFSLNQFAD